MGWPQAAVGLTGSIGVRTLTASPYDWVCDVAGGEDDWAGDVMASCAATTAPELTPTAASAAAGVEEADDMTLVAVLLGVATRDWVRREGGMVGVTGTLKWRRAMARMLDSATSS